MRCFDGSVLDDQSISLGAVTSENGCTVEREVKGLCEAQAGVTEEADLQRSTGCFLIGVQGTHTAGARWIKHLAPCFHDKRVVHRDNKDLAGILQLGGVDVARDVVLRARGREGSRNAFAIVKHMFTQSTLGEIYR